MNDYNIKTSSEKYVSELQECAQFLRQFKFEPEIALTLGSGLGSFAEEVKIIKKIPYQEIPNFPVSRVAGHSGNLIFAEHAGKNLAIFQGRVHCYEGHPASRAVFGIRVLKLLGISAFIVTNAAGGLNPGFKTGDLMLIDNHLSLLSPNPSTGLSHGVLGPQFYDQTYPYSPQLIKQAKEIAAKLKISIQSGVYAMQPGPAYESAFDINFLARNGVDAVGMSTVPEVMAMRQMGLKNILGISLITNMAAGISKVELSHTEVTETANKAKVYFSELIKNIIAEL